MIRVFEGELGREKHLIDIDDNEYFDTRPINGELIAFVEDGVYDVCFYNVWRIIDVLHDYDVNETNLFVERYIWPDER